jgi:GT2 family glycosyltransferase
MSASQHHVNPLVSVIVPTFNRAYCITRAIDSALAQTHRNIEVLVVDDGSTDDTRAVIANRYADDSRVRYVYQPNRGVASARNTGIGEVSGEFAALLDSDDFWYPWKLEMQLAVLLALPEAGMVWTDMEAIDPTGRVLDQRYLRTMYDAYRWFKTEDLFATSIPLREVLPHSDAFARGATVYSGDIFSQMVMGSLVHTSTVLLRRERLRQVRGFNEQLKNAGEDYDFHLRTCREGTVAFIDVASIQYQRGYVDRLTRPEFSIDMATNFLATILPVLERDRARIHLPAPMISAVLAEAHGWIGEAAMAINNHHLARPHLRESLRLNFRQRRLAALLCLSYMPVTVSKAVRSAYRALKRTAHC